MKSNFTKIISASILTLSLAVLPSTLPASAQSGSSSSSTSTSPTTTDTNQTSATDTGTGFDWGWLGLLGLIGLGGLARKNRVETTTYVDPNAVGGNTSYRE
ncbi:MAG: hypothetical protein PUP91_32005 [Rhizonema sp. PD37]|nr:hypothetical protein [Rhizonema sp. PD37]